MNTLFDLSTRSKIELTGRDAREFLHNLCTQDVKSLPVGDTREAFLTTNKARVLAHVWISAPDNDRLWLDAEPGQNAKIFQHLNHYLISEQVEIADRTADFAFFRLMGRVDVSHPRAFVRKQQLLGVDGLDIILPIADADVVRQRLIDQGAIPGDAELYRMVRIEAGLPEYGIDIDESRLAMEVNRTAQAISYTKGCYLGQETIVMARDRGQVNRLLMGVTVAQGPPLAAGAKLMQASSSPLPLGEGPGVRAQASPAVRITSRALGPSPLTPLPEGEGDQTLTEVGQVTSSVFSPRLQRVVALAYLKRGAWDPGTDLRLEDGRSAIVSSLPFKA